MDINEDGVVDKAELQAWIHRSLMHLDEEETAERFEEIDRGPYACLRSFSRSFYKMCAL